MCHHAGEASPSRAAIASSMSSSGATPPRPSPVSISISVAWRPAMRSDRARCVQIVGQHDHAAPALLSLATWSSFCGVMPTA